MGRTAGKIIWRICRFAGLAGLLATGVAGLLAIGLVLSVVVAVQISWYGAERRHVPETFGAAFPVTEILASKALFYDGVAYGCVYAVIRFDEATAQGIASDATAAFEVLENSARFWHDAEWKPTPADFRDRDFYQDPETCIDELPDTIAANLAVALSEPGSWFYYYGSGDDGYLRMIDPERRIAAWFRKGD